MRPVSAIVSVLLGAACCFFAGCFVGCGGTRGGSAAAGAKAGYEAANAAYASASASAKAASSSASARAVRCAVTAVREFPHDPSAYTQGLFFSDGVLYESTGQYGASTLRTVSLESGEVLSKAVLSDRFFGEGSVILDGSLYVLTWTEGQAFIYGPDLSYRRAVKYPREGWGLTTDGRRLIASDGSDRLYFMDKELNLLQVLQVRLDGRPARLLNELEWIDGRIWANVYLSDLIYVINPVGGLVERVLDCSGLLPDSLRTPDTDVLNGIAFNPADGRIYLTGKNWPRLYEVSVPEI